MNQPYGKKEFTPTEERMLVVLSDGDRHKKEELHKCLFDELSQLMTVNYHIQNMRRKLERKGQTIVVERGKGYDLFYRHVRLLASPYKE